MKTRSPKAGRFGRPIQTLRPDRAWVWRLCILLSALGTTWAEQAPRNLPGHISAPGKFYAYSGLPGSSAKADRDIDRRTPSRILFEDFLDPDGRVRVSAIEERVHALNQREAAAFLVFCQRNAASPAQCRAPRAKLPTSLLSRWEEGSAARAYALIRLEFERALSLAGQLPPLRTEEALNSWRSQNFYEALFQALESEAALRGEDRTQGTRSELYLGMKDLLRDIAIEVRPEATNLAPPSGAAQSSAAYLPVAELQRRGLDLSQLDPYDSGFWRRPSKAISLFDTGNYDGRTADLVGPAMLDPFQPIDLEFAGGSPGGTSPKCRVSYQGRRYKMKFRVPVPTPGQAGNLQQAIDNFVFNHFETQTEPVVNNLAAALGFTIEPTYFKKWVRLYLPDDGFDQADPGGNERRFLDARLRMIDAIERASRVETVAAYNWDFQAAFPLSNVGVDESGRRFLPMESVSLELSSYPGGPVGLDLFRKADYGRSLKREFRAFTIFHAWINDVDTKDANADIRLVAGEGPQGRPFLVDYSVSDMGASLGSAFHFVGKNRPNDLPYDLVRQTTYAPDNQPQRVTLNYRTHYRGPIFDAVSINDARWIVRRLAQLTPQQIRQAFVSAGYTDPVLELYTQKLLRRRDQLVEALGLMGKEVADDGGGSVSLAPLSRISDPKTYAVPGFDEHFRDGILVSAPEGTDEIWTQSFSKFDPGTRQREMLVNGAHLLAASGLRAVGAALQRIPLEADVFADGVVVGLDSFLPARYLMENPRRGSEAPFWIVDVFRLGAGVGVDERLLEETSRFSLLDFDLPARGRLVRVNELVRVRPTRRPSQQIEALWTNYYPANAFGGPLRGVQQQYLESLEPGDIVIASSYLTKGLSLQSDVPAIPIAFAGPSVGTGGHHTLVDRMWLEKLEDGKLSVAWEDRSQWEFAASAGIDLFIFRQRLLELDKRLDRRRVVSAVVDLANSEEMTWLTNRLTPSLSSESDDAGESTETEIRRSRSRLMADFLGLAFWGRSRESKETVVSSGGKRLAEMYESARRRLRGSLKVNLFADLDVSFSGESVVAGERLFAQNKLDFRKNFANRQDFSEMRKNYLPLAHPHLVLFSDEDVNQYLGTLRLRSRMLFSESALKDILSVETDAACIEFAARIPADDPAAWCRRMADVTSAHQAAMRMSPSLRLESSYRAAIVGTKAFVRDHRRARRFYLEWASRPAESRSQRLQRDLADALSRLMSSSHLPQVRLATLKSLTSPDKTYHFASLSSSLGGLPGHEYIMELNQNARGNSSLVGEFERTRNSLQPPATGVYDAVLDPLFFNFLQREGIELQIP